MLQRWLDKMNLTAEEMNVEFEKEAADGAVGEGKSKGKGTGTTVQGEGGKQAVVTGGQGGETPKGRAKEKDKEKEGDFRKGGKV